MKKYLILFLLISNSLLAQGISQDEIIGSWKAIEVEGLEKLPNKQAKIMVTMFLNATFKFQEDFRFDLILKNKNGIMEKQLLKDLTNAKWIFDPDKSVISVGNKSDNYTIMQINVLEKETQIYFLIKGSPVILKVLKEGWN